MIYNRPEYWLAKTETVVPYLTFSSPNSFTLAVEDATKHWDGIVEYSTDTSTWSTWDGTTTLSSTASGSDNVLYLRGTGNTKITGLTANGSSDTYRWVLTGSDIACVGNIENLLDYATVESGQHPTMAEACYVYMFYGCTSLTQAPTLTATTLADYCYADMFYGCTSLTQAPALSATTLSSHCYHQMFSSCTSLTQIPALPATTLANDCYYYMFHDCTSLTKAPALPATTLATNCYIGMFSGCTSLTQAPALPATTLANSCYQSMFYGCTSLTQAPALPATTLAEYCYYRMFGNCTSLKLSNTKTGEYTQEYRIPSSGTGTTATQALNSMFAYTGGTFRASPFINTTYYLSTDNMIVRDTEVTTLNGYVGSMIDNSVSNPLNITGATVGQIAKITAVDESGKPTAWESVDMPSGGSMRWQKIKEITLAEQTNDIVIGEDNNGVSVADYNPIAMKVEFHVPADSTQTNANGAPWIYPSATCTDNGIRAIGSIASWKTVTRRQVEFFTGDIDGIFAGGNINTQLVIDPQYKPTITVMDGVTLRINNTEDHWPVGTIVSLEVLSERA